MYGKEILYYTHPMTLIKPKALNRGDTIGIFTPSSPSYQDNPELFANGVRNLEKMGFKVKLGFLTEKRSSQGFRSGTPQDRAKEFMTLIEDPAIHGMISTIGGTNSNSMIPFLDFQSIRNHPKVICGYSDMTSLHLSVLKFSGLQTFYGPAVMTWFGDWPNGVAESTDSFLQAVQKHTTGSRKLMLFPQWSNHKRNWQNGEWKNTPREWKKNEGWKVLVPGEATAPILATNLNTLLSAAGTNYFPDTNGKILMIESMSAPFSMEERNLRQLQLMGVFDSIAGLIVGKPEWPDPQQAPFSHEELVLEVVGTNRNYPILSEFDCGHTLPMHTLAQMTPIRLTAKRDYESEIEILEPMVAP